MDILSKLQKFSEPRKKIILWSIIIVIGLIFFVFWIKNSQEKLKDFQREGLKLPSLKEELNNLPKIKLPEINEEELKNLKEATGTTEEIK